MADIYYISRERRRVDPNPPCGHAKDLSVDTDRMGLPVWVLDTDYNYGSTRKMAFCPDCGAELPELRWTDEDQL